MIYSSEEGLWLPPMSKSGRFVEEIRSIAGAFRVRSNSIKKLWSDESLTGSAEVADQASPAKMCEAPGTCVILSCNSVELSLGSGFPARRVVIHLHASNAVYSSPVKYDIS